MFEIQRKILKIFLYFCHVNSKLHIPTYLYGIYLNNLKIILRNKSCGNTSYRSINKKKKNLETCIAAVCELAICAST